jgi:hypothetical protein
VEVKDTGGTWRKLEPFDNTDYPGDSITTLAAITGVPLQYDVRGTSVFLVPTPNYTLASALKVYFKRGPAEFTSGEVSTGTKQPGFALLFHDLIPTWVAYEYAVENGQPSANGLLAEIQRKEMELQKFYGHRNKEDQPRLSMNPPPQFI